MSFDSTLKITLLIEITVPIQIDHNMIDSDMKDILDEPGVGICAVS